MNVRVPFRIPIYTAWPSLASSSKKILKRHIANTMERGRCTAHDFLQTVANSDMDELSARAELAATPGGPEEENRWGLPLVEYRASCVTKKYSAKLQLAHKLFNKYTPRFLSTLLTELTTCELFI